MMSEEWSQRMSNSITNLHVSSISISQLGARTVGPKKKPQHFIIPTKKIKFGAALNCLDFLPGYNMLAIGSTKAVHIVEVMQTNRPSYGLSDGQFIQANIPVSLGMRTCGMFSNIAKVENLAWYPSQNEAILAFVQMGRNITVLFDVLLRKGDNYIVQQWNHASRKRILESPIVAGSEPLNVSIVTTASMPSTPFGWSQSDTTMTECVRRDAERPGNMVEVIINTGHLEVERIAWDPHRPYTIAFTSHLTHFELWTIKVMDNKVYIPMRTLRPHAHNKGNKTHGVAFSPFDPNIIVVAVEEAKIGKVIVYDRRHLEIMHSIETTGPCFAVAFHPTFADLLAVCYRKTSVKGDSRVQFFHFLCEESLASLKTDVGNQGNTTFMHRGTSYVVEQDILPPIDSIDSLNRFRWRPCGRSSETLGDTSVSPSNSEIDAVSSQLWFSTMASKGQEISIRDAANGFSPIFSIKSVNNERESSNQREATLEQSTLRKMNDCVWVNALTLVYVFNNGNAVMTCLLDEQTACKDTLFRCIASDKTSDLVESNVLSLSAVLPTAAVVSGLFGRYFLVRNTSSSLRDYYAKIINAEKKELLEQLDIEEKNNSTTTTTTGGGGGGGGGDNGVSNSIVPVLSCTPKHRGSSRNTPKGGGFFESHTSPLSQLRATFTPPYLTTFDRRGTVSTSEASNRMVDTTPSKRFELIFPFLFSLTSSSSAVLSAVANCRSKNNDAEIKNTGRVSIASSIKPQQKDFKNRLGVLTQQSFDEKTCVYPFSHVLAGRMTEAATAAAREERLFRSCSVPVQLNTLSEREGRTASVAAITGAMKTVNPILLTVSEDEIAGRSMINTLGNQRDDSFFLLLPEKQRNSVTPSLKDSTPDVVCEEEVTVRIPPLGIRSFVTPMIEQYVLSDKMCGWAYVERFSEEETFVHYALNWEMGYDVARQMKAYRPTASMNITTINEHDVDRYFARIMAHNAKVCMLREKRMQKEKGKGVMKEMHFSNQSGGQSIGCTGSNYGKCGGNGEKLVGSVDCRGQFWSAATQAWRTHNVSLIKSLVYSQLDYCSLLGDVQYCIVLYLLSCLWWEQRHGGVENGMCSFFIQDEKPVNGFQIFKNGRTANVCTTWQWGRRALQWVEYYFARLSERKLYVPLNELMLIVSDVMGNSIPGLLRDEDRAQKLYTCVYCGTCSKAELVARPPKQGELLLPGAATLFTVSGLNKNEEKYSDSDDDSSDTCTTASCSSFVCTCVQSQTVDNRLFENDVVHAKQMRKNFLGMHSPLATSASPHNAVCRRCCYASHMTCVICEEVVEGMYLWLRSCGHGGHVHHIEQWLELYNECPHCGVPILPPEGTQAFC